MVIKSRNGGRIFHGGVTIELVGMIEDVTTTAGARPTIFLSSSLTLDPGSTNSPIQEHSFNFGALTLPHESFEGAQLHIRYFLRASVKRTLSARTVERTLWIQSKPGVAVGKVPNGLEGPVTLEVGLDGILQLSIHLSGTNFDYNGILEGKLDFALVKANICGADLCIVRREQMGKERGALDEDGKPIFTLPNDPSAFLARFQILEGPVERGVTIPFRFHMASCLHENSCPSRVDEHGLYSIRYYMFFELREGPERSRKFYKAQEFTLTRPSST